jgi:hypothetical protein
MLESWHIDVLSDIQKIKKDIRIGIIDNGSFVEHLDKFKKRDFKLDWVDISLDGARKSHNAQRPSATLNAFDVAINGLQQARKIIKPTGYVASLFTMTKLNYFDIENTADILFSANPKCEDKNLADLMAITTMTPTNPINSAIEIAKDFENDNREFDIAWQQIKKIVKKYGKNKVIVHLYRHIDLEKIAKTVSENKFLKAIENSNIELHHIQFEIDGVVVYFSPLSTWPKEEAVIDADAVVRTALSGCYSLEEYKKGISNIGENITKYEIEKVTKRTNYIDVYKKTSQKWWNAFGKKYIQQEQEVFDRIKQRAKLTK